MRALLQRIWALPWPERVRRPASGIVYLSAVRAILFPRYYVGVVAILSNTAGEVLLVRHTYRAEFPWGLPGGFLEHGEQPEAAIRRELREEAGTESGPLSLWCVYTEDTRPFLNLIFVGAVRSVQFSPGPEISDAAFYSPENLPPVLPDQSELLKRWNEERVGGSVT